VAPTVGPTALGAWPAFRTGLVTNLLNPKIGVFYLSVMPAFLPSGLDPLVGALALGAIHVAEGIVWLGLIVFLVNSARVWLTRPRVKQVLDRICGVAFIGFGVRLALAAPPR
jgi:threonine/homoserine/homoserine lactone efflux protein